LKLVGGAKGGLVWTIALTQLLTGVVWVLPLWALGLRKAPVMSGANWKSMAPIGLWAAGAHGGSVIALGAGAVSFGQILKACEPVFAAFTEVLLTGQVQAWQVSSHPIHSPQSPSYWVPASARARQTDPLTAMDEDPARIEPWPALLLGNPHHQPWLAKPHRNGIHLRAPK
jgi:hypothetical protein